MSQKQSPLNTTWGRIKAHLDALFVDHEILRKLYRNFFKVSDDNTDAEVYRSNNPSFGFLKKLKTEHQLNTVLNLRGENDAGQYWLEKEACEALGIKLINFPISSRDFPSVETVNGFQKLFSEAQYPLLLHCKSGADRAGLAATFFKHFYEGHPIEELDQLHLKYGHFRWADTGKLDFFFDAFKAYKMTHPDCSFIDWVNHHYDKAQLEQDFKANWWGRMLVNQILRRE